MEIKPVLLRTSERTTFAKCRQQWWWGFVDAYAPKTDAPALRFGSLIHKALELRYPPGRKRGPHPARTFEDLYQQELQEAYKFGFRDEEGTWNDAGELGVALMEEFVRKYGRDEDYEVIASEQTFRVKLSPRLTYVGTFDGIWRHRPTKRILLKEWKTTSQIWAEHLPLDEQAGSYWAFAPPWLVKKGILDKGDTLAGILYTFIRKQKPDTRPRNRDGLYLNQDGTVSKRQPSPIFERHVALRDEYEAQMIRGRALQQSAEMQMIRKGELGLWKAPSTIHCKTCPFRDPCELHEVGADYQPLLKAAYKRVNQYDAHAIQEEGKE